MNGEKNQMVTLQKKEGFLGQGPEKQVALHHVFVLILLVIDALYVFNTINGTN